MKRALDIYEKHLLSGITRELSAWSCFTKFIENYVSFSAVELGLFRLITTDPLDIEKMDKEVLERIAILKEFYIDLFFAIAKPNLSKEEAVEKANILMAYLDGEILNSINNRYLPGEDLLERANPNAKQLIKLLTSKTNDGLVEDDTPLPRDILFPGV